MDKTSIGDRMRQLVLVSIVTITLIGCSSDDQKPLVTDPVVIEDEILGYGEFIAHCKPYVQDDMYEDMIWPIEYGRYPGYQAHCEKICSINFGEAADAVTDAPLGLVEDGLKFVYAEDNIIPAGESRTFTLKAGYYFGYIKREFYNCTGLPVFCQDGSCVSNTEFGYTAADSFNILDGSSYTGEY